MATRAKALIASDHIEQSILILRGHKVLLDSTLARACLNHIHVCDGGNVGCSSRSEPAAIPRVLQRVATTKCAPSGRFAPAGLNPPKWGTQRQSHCLCPVPSGCGQNVRLRCPVACQYSRYWPRTAPNSHPVLATTHRADMIETGSIYMACRPKCLFRPSIETDLDFRQTSCLG
jgi:hypothetical protein